MQKRKVSEIVEAVKRYKNEALEVHGFANLDSSGKLKKSLGKKLWELKEKLVELSYNSFEIESEVDFLIVDIFFIHCQQLKSILAYDEAITNKIPIAQPFMSEKEDIQYYLDISESLITLCYRYKELKEIGGGVKI